MAKLRITYWRDIPVLVTARDPDGDVTVPLSPGFQDLVDRVAMQEGFAESDDYLAQWRPGPEEERSGTARAVAETVAAECEARLDELRARHLGGAGRGEQ